MRLFRKNERPSAPNRRRPGSTPGNAKRPSRGDDGSRNKKKDAPGAKNEGTGRVLRIAGTVLRFTVAVAVTGLTVWGGISAYRHATTSDYFEVRDVSIDGAQRLSDEDVEKAGGIEEGMNIFSLDVSNIARKLKSHPWICSASVAKKLPRTLTMEIEECKPEMIVLFDVPYLVDDSGEIFKRWTLGDPVSMAVLSGLDRERLFTDEEGTREVVKSAISLARRYRSSGLERTAPLSEIHWEVDGGFSMTVGRDPFYIRFGKGPYRAKLKRLSTLLSRMRRDGERPAIVFFDNEVRPDRVTVKVKPRSTPTDQAGVQISSAN